MLQRHLFVHDWVPSATVERLRLACIHKLVNEGLGFHKEEEEVLELLWPAIDGWEALHPGGKLAGGHPREEEGDDAMGWPVPALCLHQSVNVCGAQTAAGRLERCPDVVQVQLRDAHKDEVNLEKGLNT